jgi:hypothetical protein
MCDTHIHIIVKQKKKEERKRERKRKSKRKSGRLYWRLDSMMEIGETEKKRRR